MSPSRCKYPAMCSQRHVAQRLHHSREIHDALLNERLHCQLLRSGAWVNQHDVQHSPVVTTAGRTLVTDAALACVRILQRLTPHVCLSMGVQCSMSSVHDIQVESPMNGCAFAYTHTRPESQVGHTKSANQSDARMRHLSQPVTYFQQVTMMSQAALLTRPGRQYMYNLAIGRISVVRVGTAQLFGWGSILSCMSVIGRFGVYQCPMSSARTPATRRRSRHGTCPRS